MGSSNDPLRCRRTSLPWVLAFLVVLTAMGLVILQMTSLVRKLAFGLHETPPTFSSPGPTLVQLERLQYLVSTRVHVADVLVGESRWLQGSWVIQGDALIGVDMSKAEITNKDDKTRIAVIVLPQPAVISARVNHEKTQQWDIKARSWIPMASTILGDKLAMERQAMLEAQRLVERVASAEDYKETARRGVAGMLSEFYRGVEWRVSVQWK